MSEEHREGRGHRSTVLTQKVPDEDVLKEPRGFEPVLERLFQSPDEAELATEEKCQTASLRKVQARVKGVIVSCKNLYVSSLVRQGHVGKGALSHLHLGHVSSHY